MPRGALLLPRVSWDGFRTMGLVGGLSPQVLWTTRGCPGAEGPSGGEEDLPLTWLSS